MTHPAQMEIDELRMLGLTAAQAKAYLAIVKLGPCKAAEIASETHLQRTEVYPLMSRLLSTGLVEQTLGRPTRYRPASIRDRIPMLAEETAKRFKSITEGSSQLVTQLEALASARGEGEEPEVRVITGPRNTRRHYLESLASAQQDLWTMSGQEPFFQIPESEARSALESITSRHIKTRVITEVDHRNVKLLMAKTPLFEVRHQQPVHVRLYGVDNRSVTIGLTRENGSDRAKESQLVVTYRPMVEAMRSFFNALWNDATPFAARVAMLRGRRGLGEETRVIWGRQKIYARVTTEWKAKAKMRIVNMTTLHGPMRILRGARETFEEVRNRGVKLQVVCNICRENLSAVKELSTIAEIRHNRTPLSVSIQVLDESEGLIHYINTDTSDLTNPADVAIFTTNSRSVSDLQKMFDLIWEHSVPIESRLRQLARRRREPEKETPQT